MSELSYSILINTSNRFPGHPPAGEQEIRSTLNCTRRANQPPIPNSPEEFTDLVENYPRYRYLICYFMTHLSNFVSISSSMDIHGETQFFYGRVEAGGGEALVSVNYNSLAAFIETLEFLVDAVFHSPPRGSAHCKCTRFGKNRFYLQKFLLYY